MMDNVTVADKDVGGMALFGVQGVDDSTIATTPPEPGWIIGDSIVPEVAASGASGRRGKRGESKGKRELQAILQRTIHELDELAAEYHAKLARSEATAIGAAYARFSTRFQDSIAAQIREIFEYAVRNGIFIPREMIFFDLATRGVSKQREGLARLEAVLQGKKVQALLLFSTSRLFRKQYRTLEFVDRVHKGWGIRCVFVKSGVDTNDKQRWETLLATQSMIDQFVVTMYVGNIQAAHTQLLAKQMVFGTISFGYHGEPTQGELTKRGLPRCRIAIDPETAPIVRKIFAWYVEDKLSIAVIIRRLNDDPSIPLPPRCVSGAWTRLAVRRILANTRYRGLWRYGVCETVYLPDRDYTRQDRRAEPLSEAQIEDLRIVSDAVWYEAQARLAAKSADRGRRSKDGDRQSRPRLLNGLFWCPQHDRPLYVSGAFGKAMHCPSCKDTMADKRPLFSVLNREVALKLTCAKLAELVRADESLVQQVIAACQHEADTQQRPDVSQLGGLKGMADKLARQIDYNMRHGGETEEDQAESARMLGDLRRQRAEVSAKIEALKHAGEHQITIPTEEEVFALLGKLGQILVAAADGCSDEDAPMVREILMALTDGRINLFQQGQQKAKQGWLQGRFRVPLLSILVEQATGVVTLSPDGAVEVVIDYVRPVSFAEEAEQAFTLHQAGISNKSIGQELQCSRAKVTKLLDHAYQQHGQERPDGRKLRWERPREREQLPAYEQIADEVKRLMDEGKLQLEIAQMLDTDRDTVTRAKSFWYESRGLPTPDGRTRRKQLTRKVSHPRRTPIAVTTDDQAA